METKIRSSKHKGTRRFTVDFKSSFLILNFPSQSMNLLYEFRTSWYHHLAVTLEFIYYLVIWYINLLVKTKCCKFSLILITFFLSFIQKLFASLLLFSILSCLFLLVIKGFELRVSGIDLTSSTRIVGRKDIRSVKSAYPGFSIQRLKPASYHH